jgi:golgi SNAP receptor complex member 1
MADHDTLLSHAETGSASSSSLSSSMPVEEELLKLEIQRLLQQLQDLISFKMSPAAERSNKSQHLLLIKRYREILFDLTSDFSKSQQMWTRKREQMELFSGANTSQQQQQQDPAMEHLLRERNHIQNSLTASSSVIHQAMEIHSDLRQQGGSLRGVSGMIGTMTQTIPGLNRLVENIRRKKSRDDVIVAGVIAMCILFTLWYVFGGK